MRLVYHREKLKRWRSMTLGGLSSAAIVILPLMAYGFDTDVGAPPAPSIVESTAPPEVPDWEQISNNSDIAGSDGPVLELPPAALTSAGEASASTTGASVPPDETADADDGAVDVASGDVGDLADYEERETIPSALPLWPPPVTVVAMPRIYSGVTYYTPPSVIVVRPMGITPIPATSPMLSAPRQTHFVGGWWNRAR